MQKLIDFARAALDALGPANTADGWRTIDIAHCNIFIAATEDVVPAPPQRAQEGEG